MKRAYIECSCGTPEHVLRFTWFENDLDTIYVEVCLNQYFGFWKRLWYGVQYIFGKKSVFGMFDETVLDRHQIEELRNLCNKWLADQGLSTF